MMWLPDTNVWIAYLNPKPSAVKQAMRARPASAIYLCDVVKAELFFGAYKSQRMEANLAVLEDLFQYFNSVPVDGRAAREFGHIRAALQRAGTPIGPYDLQIAAIALETTAAALAAAGRALPPPAPPLDDYSGRITVRVTKALHRDLALAAAEEGVSLNLLISTALAQFAGSRARPAEVDTPHLWITAAQAPGIATPKPSAPPNLGH